MDVSSPRSTFLVANHTVFHHFKAQMYVAYHTSSTRTIEQMETAILFDSLSFLASALCAGFIRVLEPQAAPAEERQNLRREVREGLRLMLSNRLLRATV